MVVSSIGKPDNDDNVNMFDGSDVTSSEVLIWLPEVNYTVGRVKKSVYEQDVYLFGPQFPFVGTDLQWKMLLLLYHIF